MILAYQKASFLLSVADIKQFPPDQGGEVALAGYSNVGKSSVLNQITQRKTLAYESKTPGCTRYLNFFLLDSMRRLVDLPGYGFAKTPLTLKNHWLKLIDHYIKKRHSLKGIILVTDCRRPLKPFDQLLLDYCANRYLPIHLLINKADKLSPKAMALVMVDRKTHIGIYPLASCQAFSAHTRLGLAELYRVLDRWLSESACIN